MKKANFKRLYTYFMIPLIKYSNNKIIEIENRLMIARN